MELNKIKQISIWGEAATDLNTNFGHIAQAITRLDNATTRNKGYYLTADALNEAFPTAMSGSIAYVGRVFPFDIYRWNGTKWEYSGDKGGSEEVNLANYTTQDDVKALLASMFVPVDSENTLRDMLENGNYDENKIYYVVEE